MSHIKFSPKEPQKGKVVYNPSIMVGIVALAVSEINGVALLGKEGQKKTKGISIADVDGKIHVDISVNVNYGFSVPDVAFRIQENVKKNVESMTDYKLGNVNVSIEALTENKK